MTTPENGTDHHTILSTLFAAIDAAFEDHDDPLFGAQRSDDFRELFRRIVNLAPPPIGVGPPAHGASGGPPIRAAR